jgi:hypothetical protein
MNIIKILFIIIEFIAFILPALPYKLSTRLTILFIYFIAHQLKLQKKYILYKKICLI